MKGNFFEACCEALSALFCVKRTLAILHYSLKAQRKEVQTILWARLSISRTQQWREKWHRFPLGFSLSL
jgi:hypothetical protein